MQKAVTEHLLSLKDPDYREFHLKLIPTVNPERIIGVRTPILRNFAKDIANNPNIGEFLNSLPHRYYEENNLHGFIIERIKDYNTCIKRVNRFLPFIDNWATCDSITPKCFKNHTNELLDEIKVWLKSTHTYTVRFAVRMLMAFYLKENFKEDYLTLVLNIKSDEYYIKMMISWYFATALALQYESAVKIIEARVLDPWVHNKTIQKATESYRIDNKTKLYLKTLKI